MTQEEAISVIKTEIGQFIIDEKWKNALALAISALGAIDQYRWERDIAVEQLKELGYELGEKIRTDDKKSSQELKNSNDCISRKSLLAKSRPQAEREDDYYDEYYSGWSAGASAVVSLIEQEPSISPTSMSETSAQPEPCEDAVSRQAVINIINKPVIIKAKEQIEALPSVQPERKQMTNKEWIDFLSVQFDISRTSAREMLHGMMQCKKEDNFKKQFNRRVDQE